MSVKTIESSMQRDAGTIERDLRTLEASCQGKEEGSGLER